MTLYDTEIATSTCEPHLGISRSSNGRNTTTIAERIKIARSTAYKLLGAGLHGLNGTGPEVGKHLWNTYVTPRLKYGLETLVLSSTEMVKLETYHHTNLRIMQALPTSTAKEAIYLLLGVPPFEAQLHVTTMTFMVNCMRRPDSLEYKVIQYQLATKKDTSNSWIWHVNDILKKYSLPSAFDLLRKVPGKESWKGQVKKAVYTKWEKTLKETASQKSTLKYLNIQACDLKSPHPIWRLHAASPLAVIKATTKAKLLVQRYPLYYSRTSGTHYGEKCPLCKTTEETLVHFIFLCQELEQVRTPQMQHLCSVLTKFQLQMPTNISVDQAVQFVLDPSIACYNQEQIILHLERATRNLIFALHQERSTLLGSAQKASHCIRSKTNLLCHQYRL